MFSAAGRSPTMPSSYHPVAGNDTAAELAAISGRSRNGRTGRPESVTESMRRRLPAPQIEDGQSIEALLAQRERDEQQYRDRQTQEARARYRSDLDTVNARRRAAGMPEIDPDEELDEVDEVDEADDHGAEQETEPDTEPETPPHATDTATHAHASIQSLYDEARRAAEAIHQRRTSSSVPLSAQEITVSAREITPADVDHLWDWLRNFPSTDGVFHSYQTSVDLHRAMADLLAQGCPIRAIDVNAHHVGFFALCPIDEGHRTALLHMYFPRFLRSMGEIFPYVLRAARQCIPASFAIVIMVGAKGMPIVEYGKYGFTTQVSYIQRGT